jgi:hypothetical protein
VRRCDAHCQGLERLDRELDGVAEHILPGRNGDAPMAGEGQRRGDVGNQPGPDARRAMVACANVTGTVPNRFDSRTRAVVPPNVGVRIARAVSSRMSDLGFSEASY